MQNNSETRLWLLHDSKGICLAFQKLMGKQSQRKEYEAMTLSYSIAAAKEFATLSLQFNFVDLFGEREYTTFLSHGPQCIS